MDPILALLSISLIPILISTILYFVYKTEKYQQMSYMKKQIIAGVVLGIAAIIATEYGVPLNGAVMNVRDAAPLCAALIFGAPAGIIAGIIGGVERWFAVYWGSGMFTRTACSISTILAGIIGAVLRKHVYDDKTPHWAHALNIAIVCEVIHMLMIFITNMNDIKTAFSYVEACTLPMIITNTFAVSFAIYLIDTLDNSNQEVSKDKTPSLPSQLQKMLLYVVLIGFVVSTGFGAMIQNQIAKKDREEILSLNIRDVVDDLQDQSDETLLSINRNIVEELHKNPQVDLQLLKERYHIAEISIIDSNGIITTSTDEANIGFDMNSGDQSREFMCLLDGTESFVQQYGPIARDSSVLRKYSGVAIEDGFVQVGYGEKEFHDDMSNRLSTIVNHRHIGETGNMLIVDSQDNVISSSMDYSVDNSEYDIQLNPKNNQENTVYTCQINGNDYYYMFGSAEGYKIYAILPQDEADFSKKVSTYLNQFMQIIVSGTLFATIYLVTKGLIVNNINKVNRSLADITEGKLDTVVDVKTNKEFVSLSDGINTTVDSLKHFIAEANARIDNELKYAKEIQFSALPSNFPAFPDRNEFDIYALMDPAKEVGGDFYDLYMLNEKTLAFLVADVAGKGIPASLFMMRAKTILKSYAENNVSIADIFTNANYQLCEGNDAGMFVTAWMGFLNLETGELQYANAGHNRPLLRRKDGTFEYLKGPAGFVLAGMDGIVYKQQTLTLEPGDEIFLYTDGVVEATNTEKELYGDDRLQVCINKLIGENAENICNRIKEDVDHFYEGAEQFDDITELSMQFKKYYTAK